MSRRRKIAYAAASAVALIATLLAGGVPASSANDTAQETAIAPANGADSIQLLNGARTLYVDDTGTDTANNCQSESSPCQTIQHAIGQAVDDDTIQVAAGTYLENLIRISKAVTIAGPNESIPGAGVRRLEAVVRAAMLPDVGGITIAGLTIDGSGVDQTPNLQKRGVLVANTSRVANTTIRNNIIRNWVTGISLAGGASPGWVTNTVITGNKLENNSIGSTDNALLTTVTNNTFFNAGLGLGINATLAAPITGNQFSGLTSGRYVGAAPGALWPEQDIEMVLEQNVFDKAASVDSVTGQWYSQAIFSTISGAIAVASSGATIQVAAGVYEEALSINKSVSIVGPNTGVSPNSPNDPWSANGQRSAEAIIEPPSTNNSTALTISGNNIVLSMSGFTIDMSKSLSYISPSNTTSRYISSGSTGLNLTFTDNVFKGNPGADSGNWLLAGNGALSLKVQGNRFTGAAVSNGISPWNSLNATMEFSENVWVDNKGWALNLGEGTRGASVDFINNWVGSTSQASSDFTLGQSGLLITNNPNGPFSKLNISGNTFDQVSSINIGFYSYSADICFSGKATISNNLFRGFNVPADRAVVGSRNLGGCAPNLSEAVLSTNAFVGGTSDSVSARNDDNRPFDAKSNWWGQATGPAQGQVVGGAGITTNPWIVNYTDDPAKAGQPGFWPIITEVEDVRDVTGDGRSRLIFDGVTQSLAVTIPGVSTTGTMTVRSFTADLPTPPAGFSLGGSPVYFDIQTTAVLSGAATLCFSYSADNFAGDPTVYHFTNGAWVALPTTIVEGPPLEACASVTDFSPFALGIPLAPTPTPPPSVPPSAPVNVNGTAGDAEVIVSWGAPVNTGSFPISTYQVQSTPASSGCVVQAPALSCTVTGLTNGTAYTFEVRALNGAGWGPYSAPSAAVTPKVPDPRVLPSITITGTRGEVRGRAGIVVTGTTRGFEMGAILRPWFRFPGQARYTQGAARILVDESGGFTWQRRTGKKFYVSIRSSAGDVVSNRVIIAAR